MIKFSLVTAVYNECESLRILYGQIIAVMDQLNFDYEIIFVDDGSGDGSYEILKSLEAKDKRIKILRLNKHSGKTEALRVGFLESQGEIIVTLDSDLQDDPGDIPNFINKLKEGYDLVCGWRWQRKGNFARTIFSKVFNTAISLITGIKLHDINCGIKAFKREVAHNIELYSSLHRYIPVLAYCKGYKVAEIKVNHRIRQYSVSKYHIDRYFIAFVDLFKIIAILFKKNGPKKDF